MNKNDRKVIVTMFIMMMNCILFLTDKLLEEKLQGEEEKLYQEMRHKFFEFALRPDGTLNNWIDI